MRYFKELIEYLQNPWGSLPYLKRNGQVTGSIATFQSLGASAAPPPDTDKMLVNLKVPFPVTFNLSLECERFVAGTGWVDYGAGVFSATIGCGKVSKTYLLQPVTHTFIADNVQVETRWFDSASGAPPGQYQFVGKIGLGFAPPSLVEV